MITLLVALLAGAWLLRGHTDQLVTALDDPQIPVIGEAGGGPAEVPVPSADVIALADAAFLSDEGREIFYGTRPEILDAAAFAGRCNDETAPRLGAGGRVGCYRPGLHAIVVYRPADPRVAGQAVVTAAHETLHAAWERLTPAERDELTPLLEAAIAAVPPDDSVHAQVAASVGDHPESRPTELFAYLGTQVRGLDPVLEQTYLRFVADRASLVGVYEDLEALLDDLAATIRMSSEALTETEVANAQARAQLTADVSSRDVYRQTYQAKVDEVAAMSADDRSRLRLSWVWWDGTDLPMAPAQDTLAAAAGLLARDDAALAGRDATLAAAEASSATERARIDALIADLEGLEDQLGATG